MALPPRDADAEARFLEGLGSAPEDEILEVVKAAMDARRPALAARAVGLLPEEAGGDSPAVARARGAARMMLMAPVDRRGPVIAELEAALADLQSAWMSRARTRQRQRIKDPHQRGNTPARRKPRLRGRR